jgi:predicted transcriptional regulator
MSISGQLRSIRKTQGVTQAIVAAKSGLNQTYLSKIERDQVDPRFSTVQDIAQALDHEVLLIPKAVLQTVRSIVAAPTEASKRPLIFVDPD